MISHQGAWVAQLVERPTLGFGAGHGLGVGGSSPTSGFSLPLYPFPHSQVLSLSSSLSSK